MRVPLSQQARWEQGYDPCVGFIFRGGQPQLQFIIASYAWDRDPIEFGNGDTPREAVRRAVINGLKFPVLYSESQPAHLQHKSIATAEELIKDFERARMDFENQW